MPCADVTIAAAPEPSVRTRCADMFSLLCDCLGAFRGSDKAMPVRALLAVLLFAVVVEQRGAATPDDIAASMQLPHVLLPERWMRAGETTQ